MDFVLKCSQIGRLNLLTPTRVKAAASSEIKTGDMVPIKYGVSELFGYQANHWALVGH